MIDPIKVMGMSIDSNTKIAIGITRLLRYNKAKFNKKETTVIERCPVRRRRSFRGIEGESAALSFSVIDNAQL